MAKKLLGIDIGTETLKLVLMHGRQVKKTVMHPMPHNLVQDGVIISDEALAEQIRIAMRDHDIKCKHAAVAMSGSAVIVRRVTMPLMNEAQLLYNLPYEFRDYLSGELEQYIFDYAMITTPEDLKAQETSDEVQSDEPQRYTMDLLAAAVPLETMERLRDTMRMAGLKLTKAAPVVSGLMPLIAQLDRTYPTESHEYALLDLGSHSIRLYMFRDNQYVTGRVIETGFSALEEIVAEAYHVDPHLAYTYLLTNHENCQYHAACLEFYQRAAIEIMRVLNFYAFSNRDSRLNDVWVYGGGTMLPPMMDALTKQLQMTLHTAEELYADDVIDTIHEENETQIDAFLVQAYGITQA